MKRESLRLLMNGQRMNLYAILYLLLFKSLLVSIYLVPSIIISSFCLAAMIVLIFKYYKSFKTINRIVGELNDQNNKR